MEMQKYIGDLSGKGQHMVKRRAQERGKTERGNRKVRQHKMGDKPYRLVWKWESETCLYLG